MLREREKGIYGKCLFGGPLSVSLFPESGTRLVLFIETAERLKTTSSEFHRVGNELIL